MSAPFPILSLVAILAVLCPVGGGAQERFPAKPIEMIIPTAPGGGTDTSLRLLSEIAEADLGQKIVAVNKPGGSGTLGVNALTAAKPDGYTIAGVWFAPLTVAPHMLPVSYTPNDYAAVSLSVVVPLVFCVRPDFPAKSAGEFLDQLKASPGKYTYGTDGVGGASHLAGERIFGRLGIKVRAIPFTDSGQILKNYLGRHIDIYLGIIGAIQPYLKSGEAKCLLLSTGERNAAVPDAASLSDMKLADLSTLVWRGVIAPKGTPAERIKLLESAFVKAAQSERFRQFIEAQGGVGVGRPASEFRSLIDRDYQDFGQVVQALGIGKK